MKKEIRKIISALLVTVILLTAAPLNGFVGLKFNLDWLNFSEMVSAKDDELAPTDQCGENVTYSFNTETGELIISGTGKISDYQEYNSPFFRKESIKSIVINKGVTGIGDWVFQSCFNVTSVTIPESVTDIGIFSFASCLSLTNIIIPNGVITLGDHAFSSCQNLKTCFNKGYILISYF